MQARVWGFYALHEDEAKSQLTAGMIQVRPSAARRAKPGKTGRLHQRRLLGMMDGSQVGLLLAWGLWCRGGPPHMEHLGSCCLNEEVGP